MRYRTLLLRRYGRPLGYWDVVAIDEIPVGARMDAATRTDAPEGDEWLLVLEVTT